MIKYLINLTRGFRLRISLIILLGILSVFASLAFVWYSKKAIDLAVGVGVGHLETFCWILVGLIAFQIGARLVLIKLNAMTSVRLTNSIRSKIFSDVLHIKWQELSTLHSGDVLTRVLKDTGDVSALILEVLPNAINASLQFAGAFIMLVYMDWRLALILGIVMPLLALLSRVHYKRMRGLTHDVKESESTISKHLQESQQSQLVIRAFESQANEIERLDELQADLKDRVEKRTKTSIFSSAVMSIAFRGGYLIAFIRSVFLLSAGVISVGSLTAYLQLVGRLQMPLNSMMGLFSSFINAGASVERLKYISDIEREYQGKGFLLRAPMTLNVEHVTFTYKGDEKPALKDFSMQVTSGQMVALVGESGVGKTTLLKLLLGLIHPDSGRIEITNQEGATAISELTRTNFVYVPQGASLFNGTIRENLLKGNPRASDREIEGVLKMASAEFVYDLSEGLDTLLGERGARLSEGQAQRIAIARALLRPGSIVLMDEATSALDIENSSIFLRHLKENIGDRIIVFITHQREVVEFCDTMITMAQ